jgi:hypothetical protein
LIVHFNSRFGSFGVVLIGFGSFCPESVVSKPSREIRLRSEWLLVPTVLLFWFGDRTYRGHDAYNTYWLISLRHKSFHGFPENFESGQRSNKPVKAKVRRR